MTLIRAGGLAAALSLAILAAGCTGNGNAPSLEGTVWMLAGIRGDAGDLVPVLDGTVVTAEFSEDGRVTGSAGCNRYSGGYTVSGSTLAVTGVGSTKMFCGDPEGVMVQESRFLSLLASSTSWSTEGKALTLRGSDGQPLLVFGTVTA